MAHEGHHKEAGSETGIEPLAWEVAVMDRQFLFLGDVRNYDSTLFPNLPQKAVSFAHVWLGRGEAAAENPSLLETFCRFHHSFQPESLILTHLNERSRSPEDRWTQHHAAMIQKKLSPEIHTRVPKLLTDMFTSIL